MTSRLAILILCILLSGCTISNRKLIAQSDHFWIVETRHNDSFPALAQDYLDDPALASVIARYNPGQSLQTGTLVAIPRKNLNPAAVYTQGVQVVPILCYHQFTQKDKSTNSMVVTARAFEKQMAYLKEHGYQVVTLDDVADFLNGEKNLPDKAVVITIDDGYASYYQVAYPILKKYGYPSTLFVYTDFVGIGRSLSWQQINELNEDPQVSIQSHSKSHSNLAASQDETTNDYLFRLTQEVEKPDQILRHKTQKDISHFAYPYGNSSPELVKLLKDRDYQLALTVRKGSNPSFAAPYLLRRTMIYGQDSLNGFSSKLEVFRQMNLK
ncbi:hypothetical protein GCM10009092_24050 [Bowmanella denitrificans]|uniref:NodB homology domain-containing protein n=1 Tax=Bowmanella denitrificans TaxID=366582 RepID=A0ABN0XA49_9ALTE|nr:polysaccharide deacetylase family protein [Bowmanella denitrificans]